MHVRRPTFFNQPNLVLKPQQILPIVTQIQAPAELKWAYYISAGDQGQAGISLTNNDPSGPTTLFPTPTGPGPNPGTIWIFAALWVQFLAHPELGFVTTGLPASSTFTATSRYLSGSFNTDSTGTVVTQELAIAVNVFVSGQLNVGAANFHPTLPSSMALQVYAEVAPQPIPGLVFAPGYVPEPAPPTG